jgi:uncharacterized protein YqeY
MLLEQLDSDLKTALKEKDEVVVSALRNLKAAVKNSEIERQQPLSDADITQVIAKKVKQHRDSIESFAAGNRNDLVEHETAQMKVLQKYLPKQMDESEIVAVVQKIITDLSATQADFGKVMKAASAELKGKADGGIISKIVKENLK